MLLNSFIFCAILLQLSPCRLWAWMVLWTETTQGLRFRQLQMQRDPTDPNHHCTAFSKSHAFGHMPGAAAVSCCRLELIWGLMITAALVCQGSLEPGGSLWEIVYHVAQDRNWDSIIVSLIHWVAVKCIQHLRDTNTDTQHKLASLLNPLGARFFFKKCWILASRFQKLVAWKGLKIEIYCKLEKCWAWPKVYVGCKYTHLICILLRHQGQTSCIS